MKNLINYSISLTFCLLLLFTVGTKADSGERILFSLEQFKRAVWR